MNQSKLHGNFLKEFAKNTASDKQTSVVIEIHFKKLYPYTLLDSLEQRLVGRASNVVRYNSKLSVTCDVTAKELDKITEMDDLVSSIRSLA